MAECYTPFLTLSASVNAVDCSANEGRFSVNSCNLNVCLLAKQYIAFESKDMISVLMFCQIVQKH